DVSRRLRYVAANAHRLIRFQIRRFRFSRGPRGPADSLPRTRQRKTFCPPNSPNVRCSDVVVLPVAPRAPPGSAHREMKRSQLALGFDLRFVLDEQALRCVPRDLRRDYSPGRAQYIGLSDTLAHCRPPSFTI